MPNRRRIVCLAVCSAALCASMASIGCSSGDKHTARFRSNPTPELDTLARRRTDIDNRLTITNDTNLRSFNEDIGRLLLLDRPSRLTPQPSGY